MRVSIGRGADSRFGLGERDPLSRSSLPPKTQATRTETTDAETVPRKGVAGVKCAASSDRATRCSISVLSTINFNPQ